MWAKAETLAAWCASTRVPTREFPTRSVVCAYGMPAGFVYILKSGYVKLSTVREDGKEVLVGIVGHSGAIGLAEVFTGQPSLCTATSVTPVSAYTVNAKSLSQLAKRDFAVASEVQAQLAREVVSLTQRCEQFAGFSAEERLLWFIRDFQSRRITAPDGRIDLPFSMADLALFLAITPSYLCKVLNRLEGKRDALPEFCSALRQRRLRPDDSRETLAHTEHSGVVA